MTHKRWLALLISLCMLLSLLPISVLAADLAKMADNYTPANTQLGKKSGSDTKAAGDTPPKWRVWVSDSVQGETPPEGIEGQTYYLCYQLLGAVSNTPLDQIGDYTFKIELTVKAPDGTTVAETSYGNDTNQLAFPCDLSGTYTYNVVLSGAFSAKKTGSFTVVQRDTQLSAWFSDEEDGEPITYAPAEKDANVYLCYRLFDAQSGELLNDYSNKNYTVSLSIFNPNDAKLAGKSYVKNDKNYIWFYSTVTGVYTGTVSVTFDDSTVTKTVNVTLAKPYIVQYDANGGENAPASQVKLNGVDLSLSSQLPTRLGFNFVGWATAADASEAAYQPGSVFTLNEATTLYARWTQAVLADEPAQTERVEIRYAGVGMNYQFTPGESTSYCISSTGITDTKVSIYDQSGTLLAANSGSEQDVNFHLELPLEAGKTYYIEAALEDPEAIDVFPLHIRRGYPVIYDANGGTDVPQNTYQYHGQALHLSNEPPMLESYVFGGWNTQADGSGDTYAAGSTYAQNEPLTLYAVWTLGCPNNVHQYGQSVVAPGCTEQGYTLHICSVCGFSYLDSKTAATGHSFTCQIVTAPTAESTGELQCTCSACDSNDMVTLPKLSEQDYTLETLTTPTCQAEGRGRYIWNSALYKNVSVEAALPMSGHDYEKVVTEPSCTMPGYIDYTCKVCGRKMQDAIPAAGHVYGEYRLSKTPTVEEAGELTAACQVCQAAITVTLPKLSEHDYTYGVTTPATCSQAGTACYVWDIDVYGTQRFETVLAKLTHEPKPLADVVTLPTCTQTGHTTHVCNLCGQSYADTETAALGHAWDNGVVTTAPTTAAEGVKTYTCTRCGEKQTEAIAKLPPQTNPFADVYSADYYYDAVLWAVGNEITNGVSDTRFAPGATCTRGQIVTFLWRAAGEPTSTSTNNPFTDVKSSDFYYDAVLWAVEKGITAGTSFNKFSPNAGCTRGQVATFLWRYEGQPTPASSGNPFTDVKKSEYYYDAVLWAVGDGITNGTSATTFAPNATCTRGQIVTFLFRDMQ